MIDEPKDAQASSESGQDQTQSASKPTTKKKTTSKRVAKKAAAKKTTKKSTTKKTTKKAPATKAEAADIDAPAQADADEKAESKVEAKTTKKTAAKKTTKKTAKKKTTKRTSKKANTETDGTPEADQDTQSTEPVAESTDQSAQDADTESPSEDEAKPKRTRRRSSRKSASTENDDSDSKQEASEPKRTRSRSSSKSSSAKSGSSKSPSSKSSSAKTKADAPRPRTEMIVNYVPGEDCRIAILEDGQLEDVFSEHTNKVSRVNNIYVGRVANVEASIQAAFIDFGTEFNGFLHISDIHPQYFAKGDDKTERVGKKTPHRERPPIQDCLKKGQEIIVQVLKEGVGTKGPSLTSYLSIPGRFLVMMPGMDKVGVSRKEEDDDKRKAAKAILNTLDLPEGFGFILRTAGFDRNKTELKRDLAYLSRLWADMEKRRKGGRKPRLLYTESDLLVRTVRDLLSSEIDRVVIDSEAALKRVGRFVKIAAPRSGAKLAHYVGTAPIFHAYDIERQIEEIHAREVVLPSGGRLVIDQTEALVAIDVNSGRSRGAKDAESNAYQTNLEAVDAICRQLRLRDLGGLVVNDLIDMRYSSHRKDIENRFRERLKRDRAKTSVAQISEFGLLEMTRQRMRGSMESQHFADCPICRGRGLIQRPGSVADSALRDLASLIDHDKVHRAELVVHSRVASELLSTRRSSLIRVELSAGKVVDVRVSDSLPMDRFSLYAYEANGNDIDVEKLASKSKPKPKVVDWINTDKDDDNWAIDLKEESDESTVLKLAEDFAKKAEQVEKADLPIDDSKPLEIKPDSKSRSRSKPKTKQPKTETQDQHDHEPELDENGEPIKKKRRRRRRGRGRSNAETNNETSTESTHENQSDSSNNRDDSADSNQETNQQTAQETNEDGTPRKKRRRRRGRGRSNSDGDNSTQDNKQDNADSPSQPKQERKADPNPEPVAEPKPRRRGLYSGGRRKLTSAEVAAIDRDI